MKKTLIILGASLCAFAARADGDFVGEYVGSNDADSGYFQANPTICMQISKPAADTYKVRILPFIARRANCYAEFTLKDEGAETLKFENQGEYSMSGTIDADGNVALTAKAGSKAFGAKLERVERVSPTMQIPAPEGATLLIGGGNLDLWKQADGSAPEWNIIDRIVEIEPHKPAEGEKKRNRTIYTKEKFKDFSLHIEFKLPEENDKSGQGRGNSGFFIGPFEIQILDSFHSGAFWNECGALYQYLPPQVDASLPPEVWQTYDVEYTAPRFKDGKLLSYPVVTVYLNGIKIHGNVEISQATSHIQTKAETFVYTDDPAELSLQDHDHKVQFRNMWILKKEEK